jgi:peptidoglycan hydrolase FlgJ
MDSPASSVLSGALSLQQMRAPDPAARVRPGSLPAGGDLDRVAADFEKMVLGEMLSLAMAETDVSDSLFGGGSGERMMRPFLIEEYARSFATQGGIGVADAVRRELLKLQEQQGR